ncbi:BnaC03g23760D [Brassica napus]|uniref:BnaC03g23760D protein n=2 Tax=Brassica napus TaxID=3708 RepID=A0A078HWI5_BRANA|nr:BnaC03g23760D [Brassica napus]
MPRVPLLVVVGTGVVVVGLEAMILDKGHTVEEEAVVVAITMAVKEKEKEEAMVMDMVPQVVDIADKLQVLGD